MRRTCFDKSEIQNLSGAGSSPAGSTSPDLNSHKLHYQYLIDRELVVNFWAHKIPSRGPDNIAVNDQLV